MKPSREGAGRSPFGRLLGGIDWLTAIIENTIIAGSILLMAGVNIANVLGNNLFQASLPFTEEINQSLLVIITFVGIGAAARHGRHIRMSAIYDQLEGRWRKGLNVLTALSTAILLFVLAWYAVSYEVRVRELGQATPALGIPLWIIYVWVPIGLFIGAVQYLLTTWKNLTTEGVWRAFTEREEYEQVEVGQAARDAEEEVGR